ncbi:hypothetical protein [Aeromonas sobria]|uniref:hypothetical protein n=1 Tax=Aeromonas sobria TaxID=646 RepID=UPI0026EA67A2|nr:hypothetical protein [Aeromonas sobria]
MTDTITRADVDRLQPLCQRLWSIIQFEDAWFPFYQSEVDSLTPPKEAKRVPPVGPDPKQVWKATRARQGAFARRRAV